MSLLESKQQIMGDTMTLLVSILIRHPEIATLNFDPQNKQLQFTYIINKHLTHAKEKLLSAKIKEAISVYHHLEQVSDAAYVDVYWRNVVDFSYLMIVRDLAEFTLAELGFINELVQEQVPDLLPADSNEKLWSEEPYLQEEIIGYALEDIKGDAFDKKVVVFREEGRVMVFSK